MTIKGSGSLSLNEINTEFGRGTNLNSYRGTTWWTDSGSSGTFSSGAISISEFYGKRVSAPLYEVNFLVVGGGGGGGAGTQDNIGGGGGGGGGGGIYAGTINLQIGQGGSVRVGAGGAGGYYGYIKTEYTIEGDSYEINSWIRARDGDGSYLRYGGTTYSTTGGGGGLSRYWWNGTTSAQEVYPYRGGDGGSGYVFGAPGGLYNTSGTDSGPTPRGAGGGGGVDDATNVKKGGDGYQWVNVTNGHYGGGGSGGGDYNGGSPGGLGGGGHGGYQNTAGVDGTGGGGGGGGSYGGSAYTNGSRGGSGIVILSYGGSTQRISSTNNTASYNSAYDRWFHFFTTVGTYNFSAV